MAVCFSELFGSACSPNLNEILKDVKVTACVPDMEHRSLTVQFFSRSYVSNETMRELENALKSTLKLDTINLIITFAPEALNQGAIADIAEKLKFKNPKINGYLNGANYIITGENEINMELKFGGEEVLKSVKFAEQLSALTESEFGKKVKVSYTGILDADAAEIPLPEPPPEEPKTVSKPQRTSSVKAPEIKKMTFDYKPKDNLPVYLESAQLFYGRKTDTKVIKLCDIVPPSDPDDTVKITAWGEVFGTDIVVRDTKRGGKMATAKFSFSDGTNTVNAVIKKFFDPKYSKNMESDSKDFVEGLKPLKDGSFVLVTGDYGFDKWSGDYFVNVTGIAAIQKYEETDDYEGEKRVELHCHTNMSAHDGVMPASDVINQAFKWGHKAVAITDHGVVQAYPEMAAAVSKIRKNGGDFKVIYGVESYFIDDTRHSLEGLTNKEIGRLSNHQIILVKDLVGLKHLYELVSDANLNHYHGAPGRPIVMRSKLDTLREGLILGSACEQGELYKAIIDGEDEEKLLEIASYYDFLEIQPLGNNEFMVRDSAKPDKVDKKGVVTKNKFRHVTSLEVIKDFNRKVVSLADKLNKPVVATGDVHFLKKEDGILRQIVMAGKGFTDVENQAPLYFKTTKEMLNDFAYFGDRAKEFVIDNPNKIADMISDEVIPVPKGNYPPIIEGSDDLLREICWKNANDRYGFEGKVPEIVETRLEKELNSIISNGFSIMYISAQKLVAYSEENGYLVGSRGSVGS